MHGLDELTLCLESLGDFVRRRERLLGCRVSLSASAPTCDQVAAPCEVARDGREPTAESPSFSWRVQKRRQPSLLKDIVDFRLVVKESNGEPPQEGLVYEKLLNRGDVEAVGQGGLQVEKTP